MLDTLEIRLAEISAELSLRPFAVRTIRLINELQQLLEIRKRLDARSRRFGNLPPLVCHLTAKCSNRRCGKIIRLRPISLSQREKCFGVTRSLIRLNQFRSCPTFLNPATDHLTVGCPFCGEENQVSKAGLAIETSAEWTQ